jgi:formylglycine-generating enzyme required for sulfatase activity
MGKYEVTQGQWKAVMRNKPSGFGGDANLPVERVSWEDVQVFIRRLNNKEGGASYRLPTEAEWEYAARAGSPTTYSFGDSSSRLKEHAWYHDNAEKKTHPVGELTPNAWGVYDMYGNVREWVQDWYGKRYPDQTLTDPQGPSSGSNRVNRGCSWANRARFCRPTKRSLARPDDRFDLLGFRLLKTVP